MTDLISALIYVPHLYPSLCIDLVYKSEWVTSAPLESFHFPRLGERFINHEVRRNRQVEADIKVGERESEKQNLKSIIIL